MKHAYALLGLAFLIVFLAAYLLIEKAHAPAVEQVIIKDAVENSI